MQSATTQMRRKRPRGYPSAPVAVLLASILSLSPLVDAQQSSSSSSAPGTAAGQQTAPSNAKPKKLVLKDGSYQLVREYQINGDRVRYWDIDSSQWQEIPADLVD